MVMSSELASGGIEPETDGVATERGPGHHYVQSVRKLGVHSVVDSQLVLGRGERIRASLMTPRLVPSAHRLVYSLIGQAAQRLRQRTLPSLGGSDEYPLLPKQRNQSNLSLATRALYIWCA